MTSNDAHTNLRAIAKRWLQWGFIGITRAVAYTLSLWGFKLLEGCVEDILFPKYCTNCLCFCSSSLSRNEKEIRCFDCFKHCASFFICVPENQLWQVNSDVKENLASAVGVNILFLWQSLIISGAHWLFFLIRSPVFKPHLHPYFSICWHSSLIYSI